MTARTTPDEDLTLTLGMVQTLHAILTTGSASKAAALLGVSQPSVSHSLRCLRLYYGDDLFVRTGNSLTPTPRAMSLGPMAARLLREHQLISQRQDVFDPAFAQRQFVVCMSADAEFLALPDMLNRLAAQAPGCGLRGRRVPVSQLRRSLESGDVDLAVGSIEGVDTSLRRQLFGQYQGVCMVASSGRWASRPPTVEEFASARHVSVDRMNDQSDPLDASVEAAGVHRNIVLEVANHFVAAQLVIESGLICCLPRHTAVALAGVFPIAWHALPFSTPPVPVYGVWHERFHKDAGHIWLRGLVRDTIRAIMRVR